MADHTGKVEHSCFLIGKDDSFLHQLKHELHTRDVRCLTWFDTLASPANTSLLRSTIKSVDFVAAILEARPLGNTLLELGVAIGMDKPIMLFAEDFQSLPFDLRSNRAIDRSSIGTQSIESYIEAFLRSLPHHRSSVKFLGRRKTQDSAEFIRDNRWSNFNYNLSTERQQAPTELQLLEALKEAFRKAGFVVVRAPDRDLGPDLAVISPEITQAFGLPIVIELKTRLTPQIAVRSTEQLEKLLKEKGGGAGLLVSVEQITPRKVMRSIGPIVVVWVVELLDWLVQGVLVERIVSGSNMPWTLEDHGDFS